MEPHHPTRRDFMRQSALASAGLVLAGCASTMQNTTPGAMQGTMQGGMAGDSPGGPPVASLPQPTARQGQYAEVNGARLFYQTAGQGEPMLLLHGYPLSGALFERNREALARRFRVITPDQRNYGFSRAPGAADNVGTYAQDALELMTHLGVQRAIIGGHSMGGPIVLEMYRRAPERFRGMILIDTTAAPAPPMEAGEWRGFAEYARTKGVDQMYADALIKNMLTGATRTTRPAEVDYLGAIVKQGTVDGAVGGGITLATRPDSMSTLAQIRVPTLVYVGVDDQIYPVKTAMMMQQAIAGSTLVTIPGGAHAAVFEQPERTNEALLNWAGRLG